MKRTFCILLCLVFLACQPTPEVEYVKSKADGTLEQAIFVVADTAAPESEATEPMTPTAQPVAVPMTETPWNESFSVAAAMDRIDVTVDATVRCPADGTAPAASMRFGMPDEATVQTLIATFLGDGPLYLGDRTRTKSYYKAKMDYCAAQYEVETVERNREEWQRLISMYAGQYADASDDAVPVPWDGRIEGGVDLMTPNGDGTFRYLKIDATGIKFQSSLDTTTYIRSNAHAVADADEQAAAEAAKKLLGAIGVEAEIAGVISTEQAMKAFGSVVLDGYVVYCNPLHCGLPSTNERNFDGFDGDGADWSAAEPTYAAQFPREEIAVCVANGAVQSFSWAYPAHQVYVENAAVALLPFDEVQALFRSDIGKVIHVAKGDPMKLRVHTVRLVMERIPKKDAVLQYDAPELAEFYLVPAWEFLASVEVEWSVMRDALSNVRVLCINAIDGSIIDRN